MGDVTADRGPRVTGLDPIAGSLEARVTAALRDVADFPKPGILFKDITPVLADPGLMRDVVEAMAAAWRGNDIGRVVGIESRGFLLAMPLALSLGVPFAPARKPGKLPWRTVVEPYALEYGADAIEMHLDAVTPGERVLIVDDVLATGGTAAAVARLVRRLGADPVGIAVLVDLTFLGGRARLAPTQVTAVVSYG